MGTERVRAVLENGVARWRRLDADWQGVVIGAAIILVVVLSGDLPG